MVFFSIMLCSCNENEILILPQEYHNIDQKPSEFKTIEMQLSFTSKPTKLTIELIDSVAIMEGDIIVGKKEDFGEFNILGAIGKGKKWDNAVMHYVIQNGHPKKEEILQAINYINSKSNLKIIPKTSTAKDYVFFVNSGGCSSYVGKQGGKQKINIGGCSYGSIIHEILHASGIYHEQSRTDRDKYISIKFENIKNSSLHNFKRYVDRGYLGDDTGDYDYNSIMHYSNKAFSINNKNTIELKIPPASSTTIIGQRNGMSQGDINSLNKLYPNK